MSEVMAEIGPSPRQSLLKKYDIPVDHLDFAYVKTCTKVKEIEKIIKILRSKEEGYYPDLLKAAEKKLGELDPANRLLRVEGQLFTKDNLEPQYWKQIFDDIEKWSDESSQKEKELLSSRSSEPKLTQDNFPPIRKPTPRQMDKKCESSDKKKGDKLSSWDYKKWDNFDADAECLKMDLEEEKRYQEPLISTNKLDSFSDLDSLAKEASQAAVSLSKAEKELLANKEKELGNEFYKSKDYKQAARSYTKSIAIFPTSFAYNNRAASFLNLECFDMAVTDANMVLQLDPENVKALYRRAQANEKLSEFSKALSDLNSILKLEPDNMLAKIMKEKMKNKKSSGKSKSSAASSAKRSKLTLESTGDMKSSSKPGGASSSGAGSSSSGGRGEPTPGPSGVNTKHLSKQPVTVKRLANDSKPTDRNEAAKKRGMRKVHVLEIDRDEDNSLFDWRRYWTEGRSSKIEVASKFREKASKEPRLRNTGSRETSSAPTNKPAVATCPPVAQSAGRSSEQPDSPRLASPRSLQLGAANFTQSWELLTRERAPLADKAKLLRSVRPHLLQAVIGNKLEEDMLSDFLHCLREEFKLKTETPLVIEYLTSFAHLDRFNIIRTFLPTQLKQVIQDLMDRTNAGESLRKLYF